MSLLTSTTRPPFPLWWMPLRELNYWLTNYRRTWRASLVSSLVTPLLYLTATGVGFGSLLRDSASPLHGASYLHFLAPGLMAATAMQSAAAEATHPVYGSVRFQRTYFAAANTPLRPESIYTGHQLFILIRVLLNCTAFALVAALLGGLSWSVAGLLVLGCGLLGSAFAVPIAAWSVGVSFYGRFSILFRFVMVPLFLFSGTFFPISVLPMALRIVAYATPLWQGVALCHQLSEPQAMDLTMVAAHVGYLGALVVAGSLLGRRAYRKRIYG